MNQQMLYRQGDVMLQLVDKVPDSVKPVERGESVVLAHGSATGHKHQFSADDAVMLIDDNGQRYVELCEGAKLVHEEHETIAFPSGFYQVVQQREYSPTEIRNVLD